MIDFQDLARKWPSTIVARTEVGRFSGGLISPAYLRNLDSQGLGPAKKVRIGQKIAYPADELARWLASRVRVEAGGKAA